MPLFRFLNGELFELPIKTCSESKADLFSMLSDPPAYASCLQIMRKTTPIDDEEMLKEDKVYNVYIKKAFLLEWINENALDFTSISAMPEAIPYLEANPHRINWNFLCSNPSDKAIEWIKERLTDDEIDWTLLCRNTHPEAMRWLEKRLIETNFENITTHARFTLSMNPSAVDLLRRYPHLIEWQTVCHNKNPEMIKLVIEWISAPDFDDMRVTTEFISALIKNPHALDYAIENFSSGWHWDSFCLNPNAIPFIESNIDKLIDEPHLWHHLARNPSPDTFPFLKKYILCQSGIYDEHRSILKQMLYYLSGNPNPDALAFVEQHIHLLDRWGRLCENPFAIHILEKNRENINYTMLSRNKSIFL